MAFPRRSMPLPDRTSPCATGVEAGRRRTCEPCGEVTRASRTLEDHPSPITQLIPSGSKNHLSPTSNLYPLTTKDPRHHSSCIHEVNHADSFLSFVSFLVVRLVQCHSNDSVRRHDSRGNYERPLCFGVDDNDFHHWSW